MSVKKINIVKSDFDSLVFIHMYGAFMDCVLMRREFDISTIGTSKATHQVSHSRFYSQAFTNNLCCTALWDSAMRCDLIQSSNFRQLRHWNTLWHLRLLIIAASKPVIDDDASKSPSDNSYSYSLCGRLNLNLASQVSVDFNIHDIRKSNINIIISSGIVNRQKYNGELDQCYFHTIHNFLKTKTYIIGSWEYITTLFVDDNDSFLKRKQETSFKKINIVKSVWTH